MSKWATLSDLGVRQHLAVAVWQAAVLGISEHALRGRVGAHGWARSHAGVVSLPGAGGALHDLTAALLAYSQPASAAARVEKLLVSGTPVIDALVSAGLGAGPLVCGPSALALRGVAPHPSEPWIRLPARYGHAPKDGVRIRYGDSSGKTAWVDGVPSVDVAQAFIDAALAEDGESATERHHRLCRWLATADARRVLTAHQLETTIASPRSFYGAPGLRRVVADVKGELSHSATERRARRLAGPVLASFGLRLEPRPFLVEVNGTRLGEADLAVVQIRYDIEIDGPHHLLPAQRQRDDHRDRVMRRRAGWEVERFPTELIDLRPTMFKARVADAARHLQRRFDPDPRPLGRVSG